MEGCVWDKDRIEKVIACTVTYRRIGRSCGWLWRNKKAETRKRKLWVSDKGDLASNTIQIEEGDSAGDTLTQETWSSISTFYMWLTSVMTWVGLLVLAYCHIPSLEADLAVVAVPPGCQQRMVKVINHMLKIERRCSYIWLRMGM